jgi:carboxymethylenebutenolidase
MGHMITLKASDGHELGAYVATPTGIPKGAVVVVQEIFGVNPHIKSVVDDYASLGYYAIAPALFDRFKRDIELKYSGLDMAEAFALYKLLSHDSALKDVSAAFQEAQKATGKTAVVGFCFGGLMSWLSATRGPSEGMNPVCCVAYYPGGIGGVAKEQPTCPVMIHIGSDDSHIGEDQIDAVKEAHPEVPLYLYAGAEHGFNCDARDAYNPQQAAVAKGRTLEFLAKYLG